MGKVALQPDLMTRVQRIVQEKGTDIEDFIAQAVQEYLDRLEDRKLEAEAEAFEEMHPQLVEHYLGQFVAIHNGQVIDADADFEALFLRVQESFEATPILIRRVGEQPTLGLRSPGPHLLLRYQGSGLSSGVSTVGSFLLAADDNPPGRPSAVGFQSKS